MRAIFIGGTGRCGTTVLRRALARHPDMAAIPGEFRIITDPGGLMDIYNTLVRWWTPGRANQALHTFKALAERRAGGITKGYNLGGWCGDRDWFLTHVESFVAGLCHYVGNGGTPFYETVPMKPATAQGAIRAFIEGYYDHVKPGALAFVDDTPDLIPLRAEVETTVGHGRRKTVSVWAIRDPRDVLASFIALRKKANWTSDDRNANALRIVNVLKRSSGDVKLRLEDLVEKPGFGLEKLVRDVGLPDVDVSTMAGAIDPAAAHIGRHREENWDYELTAEVKGQMLQWTEALGYTA